MVPWSLSPAPPSKASLSLPGAAPVRRSINASTPQIAAVAPTTVRPISSLSYGASDGMAQPSFAGLNGPDSPPVLYHPCGTSGWEEEEERCRACHSNELVTDWKQGDRICTNCGVVAEEHLRDERPEWKDFHEAEDLVKGLPSGARSGLVPVDESKYLGGLQPTTLSKHAFGGDSHGGYGMARMRKRLKTTNKRLDSMMEKIHTKALKEARLDRKIRLKRGRDRLASGEGDASIRPELEQLILQEEEDAHRLHEALQAEKWSLDRAILLNGKANEQREVSEAEREDLDSKLDSTLRKASQDLYAAYTMLQENCRDLHLPEKVQTEATHRLVRFVTRKDGFRVTGVASRLSRDFLEKGTPQQRKEALRQLQEHNLRKQMAGLNAALLFLTARSLGWGRSLAEICASVATVDAATNGSNPNKNPLGIKPKHVSRAVKEIQSLFPEYARLPPQGAGTLPDPTSSASMRGCEVATANFAEHALRKLQLPPVAEASIRALLLQMREEQIRTGQYSGAKLSTLCAGIAYLVCSAGSVMQRLAQQHRESLQKTSLRKSIAGSALSNPIPRKKRRLIEETQQEPSTWNKMTKKSPGSETAKLKREKDLSSSEDDKDDEDGALERREPRLKVNDDDEPFDVFTHAAIVEDPSEKQEYELRRMWDAWAEQMSWTRSIGEVEQSCGVSRNVIKEFYKTSLYARRHELLQSLSTAVGHNATGSPDGGQFLRNAPLAPILLAHVSTASSLMSSR